MNEIKCPKCGADCEMDEVDIGVGIQYGPPYCIECGWDAESELRKKRPELFDESEGEEIT